MRDPVLTAHARTMRKTPTEPEQRLWLALRAERLGGLKFRRQKVIGPFIVDFAVRNPMLVVEVDGDSHAQQEIYDERRSVFLRECGYRVLRFTNQDVMTNMESVLMLILETAGLAPLPTLSPEGERA
ncbi:MAG: endonuclease domain-containing protein [Sphingobium sp.]|nr:endonuclease domain-containing protein [Sphingobium sp.]